MRKLPSNKRTRIIRLLRGRLLDRKVGQIVGVSPMTVGRVRKNDASDIVVSRGGRPRLLSTRDERLLVRQATSGKADTAVQLKKNLQESTGVEVSASTIRRSLKKSGLRAVVKTKKPRLLPHHIKV